MMTKVLIIEDEKPAADYLAYLIRQIDPDIQIIAKIDRVKDSVAWLAQNSADLIFMDIHLADGNCFSIFDEAEISTPVIFTTAYDQYAIKAFKVNSIDYLLKPIQEDELRKSIQKFRLIRQAPGSYLTSLTEMIRNLGEKSVFQQRFMVYAGEKIRAIKTADVAYFYITEKSVFLCATDGKHYGIDYSLDKIENMVDPAVFFRINRRFIINIESIDTMYQLSGSRIQISLKPAVAEEVIVSFHRISAFKKWLNK